MHSLYLEQASRVICTCIMQSTEAIVETLLP